ncbi:MAG: hypothetical protein K0R00_124 [Herbinix sp.]|jgi:hypothetical protein|nr:hypothetical protein [Herbinix sp.]
MSQKFIIELDDDQIERLDNFQLSMGCKYRVDAVRHLVSLLPLADECDELFFLASIGGSGIRLLNVAENEKVHIVNKESSPEISEWTTCIHYHDNHVLVDTQTNLQKKYNS